MIRRAITDDALVFIACFSNNSLSRNSSYQNRELMLAIEELSQRKPDDSWLIPVRFDDCLIPNWNIGGVRTLRSLHRVDLFGASRDAGLARLTTAVSRLLHRPATSGRRKLLDQDVERAMLRSFLEREGPAVILVHGPPGAGKSELVTRVLTDMSLGFAPHDMAPGDRFDACALLKDIESPPFPGVGPSRSGDDVLSRLEVAVERPDDNFCCVVVDSAQHLLEPGASPMISLELDEALEVIACGSRSVKVILILRELPVPRPGSEWAKLPATIPIRGLPRGPFGSYLRDLDPAGQFGLASATQEMLDILYGVLQGIPRLAGLFCTVLAQSKGRWTAVGLAHLLGQVPAGRPATVIAQERERRLAHEIIGYLTGDQRTVVIALAAFVVPVTMTQMRNLLAEELSGAQIIGLLRQLVDAGVVGMKSDRYYLPTAAIQFALELQPDGPVRLRHLAANELADCRIPDEMIRKPEDLDTHFAELDLRVRIQLWESSYELVEKMDRILSRWNASDRLLKYREAMAGRLETRFQEMVNYDALGCIYGSRGLFGEAGVAFDKALRNANISERPDFRRKVYINLAGIHLVAGNTREAARFFENARALAEEHVDSRDLIPVWSGLADCFRHWGNFSEAIRYARRALPVAALNDLDWMISLTIRLARWHSELGQHEEARRLLEQAEEESAGQPDLMLSAQCLDLRADLLLDSRELAEAKRVAEKAVAWALRLPDPVTALQARTTLAMACLRLNDLGEASRQIDHAARHRRAGRSLIVLALKALVAFRADRDDEARRLFAELEREAFDRRERDARDFAAWDFEGLAICGRYVGGPDSLDPAIEKFQQARRQAPLSPVLESRLRFMLGLLQAKATPGQLDQAMAAATDARMTRDHA
jgi:tetratricopeptide (TPR) repeat protein